jgi:hypothetical protein
MLRKRIFGGWKRILRPPRTIPLAILLVETNYGLFLHKKPCFHLDRHQHQAREG